MKNFDLEAAKKGAKVCTREGRKARILCFDLYPNEYIAVAVLRQDFESVEICRNNGENIYVDQSMDNLMMADDDYLEKLDRGEYSTPVWQEPHRIMTPEQIAAQPFASISDEGYWRKMYAGMAMQGLCRECVSEKTTTQIAYESVMQADALIEELKKPK